MSVFYSVFKGLFVKARKSSVLFENAHQSQWLQKQSRTELQFDTFSKNFEPPKEEECFGLNYFPIVQILLGNQQSKTTHNQYESKRGINIQKINKRQPSIRAETQSFLESLQGCFLFRPNRSCSIVFYVIFGEWVRDK